MGECRIVCGRYDGRMRMTISCANRYPTWDEVRYARYRLLPARATVAMLLPPPELYVDPPGQTFTFELVELHDDGAAERDPSPLPAQPSWSGSE